MSDKEECPNCMLYTSAILRAFRDGGPCPSCGWSADANSSSAVTLVEFLRARYDEDEAAAKAATGSRWRVVLSGDVRQYRTADLHDTGDDHYILDELDEFIVGLANSADSGATEADARHFARHDPARVLAEVDAKRKIVELHDDQHECTDLTGSAWPYVGCQTLRLLALPYADHPDYNQAWRP